MNGGGWQRAFYFALGLIQVLLLGVLWRLGDGQATNGQAIVRIEERLEAARADPYSGQNALRDFAPVWQTLNRHESDIDKNRTRIRALETVGGR